MRVKALGEHGLRMRVIRAEYAKGYGAAKRSAEILGMSHTAVRKFASKYKIARPYGTKANAQSSDRQS